jgi:hypothetical protein
VIAGICVGLEQSNLDVRIMGCVFQEILEQIDAPRSFSPDGAPVAARPVVVEQDF